MGELEFPAMPLIPESFEPPFDVCSMEAIVYATMFYPAQKDAWKRHHIACHFEASATINIDCIDADNATVVSGRNLKALYLARHFEDFEQSREQFVARGFYAAHWLRYRLYAAQACRGLGTNNRWEFYVLDEIVPKVPMSWPRSRNLINAARVDYAPVAHLWLAWFDQYHDALNLFVTKPPPAPQFRTPQFRQRRFETLLGRAKAYFDAAHRSGLYCGTHGLPSLEEVWQLPAWVVSCPAPELTVPDLLVPDFDPEDLFRRYEFCRAGN